MYIYFYYEMVDFLLNLVYLRLKGCVLLEGLESTDLMVPFSSIYSLGLAQRFPV